MCTESILSSFIKWLAYPADLSVAIFDQQKSLDTEYFRLTMKQLCFVDVGIGIQKLQKLRFCLS